MREGVQESNGVMVGEECLFDCAPSVSVSPSLHPSSSIPPPREVKLSVVSYLTNSIVDQILQELYSTHKTLVNIHVLY